MRTFESPTTRTIHTGNRKHHGPPPIPEHVIKKYGKAHGHKGEPGGWIYDAKGQHLAHGWNEYAWFIGINKIKAWWGIQQPPKSP